MKTSHFKFYISTNFNDCGDRYDVLYATNTLNGHLFWFDDLNGEWHGSLYSYQSIKNDPDFNETTKFDNGYINIDDALDPLANNSLIRRYPNEFGDIQLSLNGEPEEFEN